ncbi:MAG: glycoside hydrolase family 16 protein [Clostridiales bacterium]|jgi:hypothetical protein|nr:glycoside hydrolase family 16 protein [Clostridiales bacterium]
MKKKALIVSIAAIMTAIAAVVVLTSPYLWFDLSKADKSLPNFATAGLGVENANGEGWYLVFSDEFEGSRLNSGEGLVSSVGTEIWTTSPHGLRKATSVKGDTEGLNSSYWCPSMVTLNDGKVEIRAEQRTDHMCEDGICPSAGIFTGGIETRRIADADTSDGTASKGTNDELLFGQAFGYFEAYVRFPDGPGIWSAFWLQSSNQRKMGNLGKDGTEIDIYESAFVSKPSVTGHALLWNGYTSPRSISKGTTVDTGVSLYGAYHKFALKWTPDYYVFYVDDVPTWVSNDGGVSRVKEFLRLTVEVDEGDGWGPHGQIIGRFDPNFEYIFYVDYVKVYQNVHYAAYEKPDSYYKGDLNLFS